MMLTIAKDVHSGEFSRVEKHLDAKLAPRALDDVADETAR